MMSANRFVEQTVLIALCCSFSALVWAAAAPAADPLAEPPTPAFPGQTGATAPAQPTAVRQEVLLSGLDLPRSLVALPDGKLLVTEGSGTVRVLSPDGTVSEPLPGMPDILSVGGRSMNDFILDADFAQNRRVYFTYLAPARGQRGGARTPQERTQAAEQGISFQVDQVARAQLAADLSRIEDVEVIATIPGRRLLSAPDGTLFISTMAFNATSPLAQDSSSLNGKILRINADGSIPADNPHAGSTQQRQEIFSMGHRDPDGLFLHPDTGEVWAIEHGPMGGDEVNVIRAGKNYGWPTITYGKEYDGSILGNSAQSGMEQPLYYWYPSVAPSGLLIYTGNLFAAWQGNLLLGTMSPTQGKYLMRLALDGERVVEEEHLLVEHDRRVRALAQGADGALYVLTDSEANNQTNRHFPGEVLRLTPQ
jgi:glucose/arabinose dehydrogenase